jgi:hypothetical protein
VASGFDAVLTEQSVRDDSILVLCGLGGSDRIIHANRRGLIAFDAGYWDRKLNLDHRKYRVSFNGFHSPQYVMRGESPPEDRMLASGIKAAEVGGKPSGPVMLVGNAPKSNRIGAEGWSAAMAERIREAFPDRKILYRHKPKRPAEYGVKHDAISHGPIEDALRCVSLVVCRHSNVAVDACRMGVPVVCEDGAAAAIYPRSLADHGSQPTFNTRREFLARLAWWQWSRQECESGEFWTWAKGWFDEIR